MSLRKAYVGTSNPGKLREIIPLVRELFPKALEVVGESPIDAVEDAPDFIGNAQIKAHVLYRDLKKRGETGFAVLADDSGLCVDALGGRPGVHSARYAGDHVAPETHMEKLLRELGDTPMAARTARYVCALCWIEDRPDGPREWLSQGTCEGRIGFSGKGGSGFGYDPVFEVPDRGDVTMAQLSESDKNGFSHRRRAFDALALAVQQDIDGTRIKVGA